jgi:hypothetical protein
MEMTIRHASLGINSEGKRYSHQRRLTRKSLEEASTRLLTASKRIAACNNFEDLINLIENIVGPISGIGELYIYDTSFRIGAFLGMLPRRVYLHAGTRTGAKALGFDGRVKSVAVENFPPEWKILKPYEIEDVLCIFKDKIKKRISLDALKKRSRCY